MKPIISILVLLFSLALTVTDATARSAPLVEKVLTFDVQSKQTLNQVHDYLVAGIRRYKSDLTYKITSDIPGVLQVDFNEQQELYFTVAFTYNNQEVRTQYISSKDFSYSESDKNRFIHPDYMEWMEEIMAEVKFASALQLDAKGEPTHPESVAHITLRPGKAPIPVKFSMSEPDKKCGSFDTVGVVENISDESIEARRKEIEESNEKYKDSIFGKRALRTFVRPKTAITMYVLPGVSLQFRSYYSNGTLKCFPTDVRLIPLAGKKYTVEFQHVLHQGLYGACGQAIFDDTIPGQRVMAPYESLDCKNK